MPMVLRCNKCNSLNKYYNKLDGDSAYCQTCKAWLNIDENAVDTDNIIKMEKSFYASKLSQEKIDNLMEKEDAKFEDVKTAVDEFELRIRLSEQVRKLINIVYTSEIKASLDEQLYDPYNIEQLLIYIYPVKYFEQMIRDNRIEEVNNNIEILNYYDYSELYKNYAYFLISVKKGLNDIAKNKAEELIKEYISIIKVPEYKNCIEIFHNIAVNLIDIHNRELAMNILGYMLENDIYYKDNEEIYKKLKNNNITALDVKIREKDFTEQIHPRRQKIQPIPINKNTYNDNTDYSMEQRTQDQKSKIYSNTQSKPKGSIGSGMMWMAFIGLLLCWLPFFGQLIAGVVGGKKSGSIGNALGAVFLPGIISGMAVYFGIEFIADIPFLSAIAGAGVLILSLAHIGPLLIGAIIGGLTAE